MGINIINNLPAEILFNTAEKESSEIQGKILFIPIAPYLQTDATFSGHRCAASAARTRSAQRRAPDPA